MSFGTYVFWHKCESRIIKKAQEKKFENRILGEPALSIANLQGGFVDSTGRLLGTSLVTETGASGLWEAGKSGAAAKADDSLVLACPIDSMAPVSGDRSFGGSRS